MTISIIKHEAVPNCGSFEVKYSDGQPSRYFYFEDVPGRLASSLPRGWLWKHVSGTYVKFTQAGADLFA